MFGWLGNNFQQLENPFPSIENISLHFGNLFPSAENNFST